MAGATIVVGGKIIRENHLFQEKNTNTEKAVTIVAEEIPPAAPETVTPAPIMSAIAVDNGWGHFGRIFDGSPGPDSNSILDPKTVVLYLFIHNTGAKADLLMGSASEVCSSITINDMNIQGGPGSDVISNVVIPADGTVELKFNGVRMVCNGAHGVNLGDRVPMTLFFDEYGEVPATIEIRDTPA